MNISRIVKSIKSGNRLIYIRECRSGKEDVRNLFEIGILNGSPYARRVEQRFLDGVIWYDESVPAERQPKLENLERYISATWQEAKEMNYEFKIIGKDMII